MSLQEAPEGIHRFTSAVGRWIWYTFVACLGLLLILVVVGKLTGTTYEWRDGHCHVQQDGDDLITYDTTQCGH